MVAIYVWWFDFGVATTALLLVGLAGAVFVPLKYIHPSRMQRLWWSANGGAALWLTFVAVAIGFPDATEGWHLIETSLLYPIGYLAVSFWLGGLAQRETDDTRPRGSIGA